MSLPATNNHLSTTFQQRAYSSPHRECTIRSLLIHLATQHSFIANVSSCLRTNRSTYVNDNKDELWIWCRCLAMDVGKIRQARAALAFRTACSVLICSILGTSLGGGRLRVLRMSHTCIPAQDACRHFQGVLSSLSGAGATGATGATGLSECGVGHRARLPWRPSWPFWCPRLCGGTPAG